LSFLDEERQERFLGLPSLPGLPSIGNPNFGLPNLRGGNPNPVGNPVGNPRGGNNPLVSINGGAGGGGGPNAPGGNGGPVFAPTFIFAKAKAQAAQQG